MSVINIEVEKAIKDVKELVSQLGLLKNSITSIQGVSSSAFKSLTARVDELETQLKQTNSAMKTVASTTSKMQSQINKATAATERNTEAQKRNTTQGKKMGSTLARLAGALGFAGVALAIGNVIKSIITLTIKFQSLGFALEKTAGNLFETGRSMQFLMELNDKFGAELITTTERWLKFRTAARQSGLTLLETKRIFESVTKASAVLGLATDELKGVYLALEQMLSKGKITTEELRRQLGERLPGAMGIMAASMGVTISELDKMMKKGEVLSAEVLPAFAEELERAYGIESLNSVENLSTAVGKLTGQWQQFVLTISEGDSVLTNIIGGVLEGLESLLSTFTTLAGNFDQVARSTQGFFNAKILKEYSDVANSIIEKNKEFARSENNLLEERKNLIEGIVIAQEKGDVSVEKSLKERKKLIDDEIRLINVRKKELIQSKAEANLTKEVQKTLDIREELVKRGQEDFSWTQKTVTALQALPSSGGLDKRLEILSGLTIKQREYVEQLEREAVTRELAEKGSPTSPTPTPTGGGVSRNQTRFAKEFLQTNKALIENTKKRIAINNNLINQEGQYYSVSSRLLNENYESEKHLLELAEQDAVTAVQQKIARTEASWQKTLNRFDKEGNLLKVSAEQQEQYEQQLLENKKELDEKRLIAHEKYLLGIQQLNFDYAQKRVNAIDNDAGGEVAGITADLDTYKAQWNARNLITAEGTAAQEKLNWDLAKEEIAASNEILNVLIDAERKKMETYSVTDSARIDASLNTIASLEAQKETLQTLDEQLLKGEGAWENWSEKAVEVLEGIGDLVDALFERRIQQIEAEIEAETDKYDRLLELAKNDEEEQKVIERNKQIRIEQLEKKKKKEQIKQAKFEKAINIAKAAQAAAVAFNVALTGGPFVGPILAAITAGLSAVQLATIIATPIPRFAKGGISKKDQAGMINDGGKQEFIERDGEILTTNQKNAIVNLKKGDTVIPSFEDLQRQSIMANLLSSGEELSSNDFDKLSSILEMGLEKGFKKAKINNRVSVLNKTDSYRDKMQNWN